VSTTYPAGKAQFDPTFDLSKPEVQEAIVDYCEKAKADLTLGWREEKGVATHTPMVHFKQWITGTHPWGVKAPASINAKTQKEFPIRNPGVFRQALMAFLNTRNFKAFQRYFFYDEDGKIKGVYANIFINLNQRSGGSEAALWFDRWEDFTQKYNAQAPVETIQTSSIWVRIVMEREAIRGAAEAWALSNVIAFLCIFVFTGNLIVSMYVILSVTGIVACLLAFMVVWMQWSFGAIEAIALTIFVGFSVDYCLHLAHAYNEADYAFSFLKMRQSLTHTGVSVFSAAVTTIGSATFLVFCDIQIFVQMGLLIGCNTVLAIIFSLGIFASLMMGCGPTGNCGTWKCCFRSNLENRRKEHLTREQKGKQRKMLFGITSSDKSPVDIEMRPVLVSVPDTIGHQARRLSPITQMSEAGMTSNPLMMSHVAGGEQKQDEQEPELRI
jgi:hypothetical protein